MKPFFHTRRPPKHQHGFTLIEVVVAMVVLSVGLLGTAALVMKSLKNSSGAYYRSQATVLANDVMDRMRANLPNERTRRLAEAAKYQMVLGQDCTGSGLPKTTCQEWQAALAANLPGGQGGVSISVDGAVTITIRWHSPTETFVTTTWL